MESATHAEFALGWDDGSNENSEAAYKTHQKSSTIVNTGKLVRAVATTSRVHLRNMTYTVPAGVFHRSEVTPDILHATIFFFDSRRGFEKYAPVLGPVDGKRFTQHRDPACVSPAHVAYMVEAARNGESS